MPLILSLQNAAALPALSSVPTGGWKNEGMGVAGIPPSTLPAHISLLHTRTNAKKGKKHVLAAVSGSFGQNREVCGLGDCLVQILLLLPLDRPTPTKEFDGGGGQTIKVATTSVASVAIFKDG